VLRAIIRAMSETQPDTARGRRLPSTEWFVVGGGAVYATGFLVAFLHADFLGAPGTALDLFRTQYLLIGVMCVALPLILIAGAIGLKEIRSHRSKPNADASPRQPLDGSSILLTFNLLLTLYTFLLFAPRSYLRDRPHLVLSIFIATTLGVIGVNRLAVLLKDPYVNPFHKAARRILCLLVVIGLDGYCFWGLRARLLELAQPRDWPFLLLVASIVFALYRTRLRFDEYGNAAGSGLLAVSASILGLLYVLMVFAFAYTIYPQIPSGRGGGDFSEAPTVILTYSKDYSDAIPAEYKRGTQSQPLVLIEEDAQVVVVADPAIGKGPDAWRLGIEKPALMLIPRTAIASMVFRQK
jgi:hypothetical protein